MVYYDYAGTMEAMRSQEKFYISIDYMPNSSEYFPAKSSVLDRPIDQRCRLRMVDWCFRVIEFFKLSQETVFISMTYLDCFMSTTSGSDAKKDRRQFQLAVMACLYIAVKIHESTLIASDVVVKMSNGAYTEQKLLDMEHRIIEALHWRLNPPTPMAFIRSFLSIIFTDTTDTTTTMKGISEDKATVLELARRQIKLALREYRCCVCTNASSIALAALLNAVQKLTKKDNEIIISAINKLAKISDIDISSPEFLFLRDRLWSFLIKLSSPEKKKNDHHQVEVSLQKMNPPSSSSLSDKNRADDAHQSMEPTSTVSPRGIIPPTSLKRKLRGLDK